VLVFFFETSHGSRSETTAPTHCWIIGLHVDEKCMPANLRLDERCQRSHNLTMSHCRPWVGNQKVSSEIEWFFWPSLESQSRS
jgi:hypothetical protein